MAQPESEETFCSAVSGVVCEDCPLNFMGENEWKTRMPSDMTPFQFSEVLPRALDHIVHSPEEIAERSNVRKTRQSDMFDALFEHVDTYGDTEAVFSFLKDEGVDVPIMVDTEGRAAGDAMTRQLHACVGRIAGGNCTEYTRKWDEVAKDAMERKLHPVPSSPLSPDLTLDFAGDTLTTIAKFGSDDEVATMAQRLRHWVDEEYGDEPIHHDHLGDRGMLMAIAAVLDTLAHKKPAKEDD